MPNEERTYYCICLDNCRFETMTKEQILAAIVQAVETHEITDVDTGFITKIKEKNKNSVLKFWVGTSAEYNAVETKDADCMYVITDDDSIDDIEAELNSIENQIQELGETIENQIQELEETIERGVPEKNKLLLNVPTGVQTGTTYTVQGINDYSIIAFDFYVNGTYEGWVVSYIGAGTEFRERKLATNNMNEEFSAFFNFEVGENTVEYTNISYYGLEQAVTVSVKNVYGIC